MTTHKDAEECPSYYDGCHCTTETMRHNIERAENAEKLLATKDAEIARLKLERDNFAEIARFKEAEAISEYTRAERAESENVKLREIVEELAKLRDAAGREPIETLHAGADILRNAGGGPLEDCIRLLATSIDNLIRRAQELSKQEGNK